MEKDIVKTVKFIKRYMLENKVISIRDYCSLTESNRKIIINHYIHNKIDKFFFVWLIKIGYLILNDNDRAYIPYIISQYREIMVEVDEIKGFFNKVKRSL